MSKKSHIQQTVTSKVAQVLSLSPDSIAANKPFSSYGLDSIVGVELINKINDALGIVLKTIVIFDYPNVTKLTDYIAENFGDKITGAPAELLPPTHQNGNGKAAIAVPPFDQQDLVKPNGHHPKGNGESAASKVQKVVKAAIAKTLRIAAEEVTHNKPFASMGIDSIIGVELINEINARLGIVLKTIVIFDYANVTKLTDYILDNYQGQITNLEIAQEAPTKAFHEEKPPLAQPSHEEVFEVITNGLFDEEKTTQEPFFDPFETEDNQEQLGGMNIFDEAFEAETPATPPTEIFNETPSASPPPVTPYQCVVFEKPVCDGSVSISDIALPNPGPNEVQVLVKAFPINFSDFLLQKGLYPIMPEYPFTPGVEVSGIVHQVGSGVTHVKPGQAVIALTRPEMGGQAALVNTDANFVVPKPENVTHEEAGGFAVPFLCMYVALEKAGLRKGEKILIATGTGNNGLVAIQLAQSMGAEVYTTVSSDEKARFLQNMGVKNIINHRQEDFAQRILEMTDGYGVDVVANTVAGDTIQKGLSLLAPNGRYVELAVFGLQTAPPLDFSNFTHNQAFHSLNIKKFFLDMPEKRQHYLNIMTRYLAEGTVKPILYKTFPFESVKAAYETKGQREIIGRIMVAMPNIPQVAHESNSAKAQKNNPRKDIAIVGYSGRFPKAKDAETLWQNLCQEKDAMKEVPPERWRNEDYYDANPGTKGKTYCKWGAFMDDVDKFDANFFSITPKEATQTDPQQRVFLQESYRAIAHAGYSANQLDDKKCGVFVGVGPGGYLKRMEEHGVTKHAQAFWGNETSILAARISYYLNLKGPSIAINTACSSSLVAAHMACASIQSGESDMAIAGGVFVSIDPDYYLVASDGNMFSPEGRCKTFDNNANGFGPGEAAGAMVLKPLEDAIRDNDYIHGVIKGSSINQDGKTNGITAPSANAQAAVQKAAYENAGISPETIGYIEAHGTGTKLGDPIEIEGLTQSFAAFTPQKQFCRIGSIKTNVGHTAAAAGITGLIKLLLSLKHGKLPATIHFDKPNALIDFEDSPFIVNTALTDWKPVNGMVKRAAISSYGFSGTNAHMVLEEAPNLVKAERKPLPCYLIPLSAESNEVLAKIKSELITWLDNNPNESLQDVAYTLQQRRGHFSLRAAYVVDSLEDLASQLANGKAVAKASPSITMEEAYPMMCLMEAGACREACEALAQHYLAGEDINWDAGLVAAQHYTVPMPAYPFIGERYWIDETGQRKVIGNEAKALHPLVHQNTSTAKGFKFTSQFTGNEYYLEGHQVNGQPMLPGAAYVEMGLAAAQLMAETKPVKIKDVQWLRPMIVASPQQVDIVFESLGDTHYAVQFVDQTGLELARLGGQFAGELVATSALDRTRFDQGEALDIANVYQKFTGFGLNYSPAFQPIKALTRLGQEALAQLSLTAPLEAGLSDYTLHPALLDGAFQSLIALYGFGEAALPDQYLPFGIAEINLFQALTAQCWVHIKDVTQNSQQASGIKHFDIGVYSQAGEALIEVKGFAIKKVAVKPALPTFASAEEIFQQLQNGQISEAVAEKSLEQLMTMPG